MGWWWQQKSEEPCKKEACDIQACLSKNNFDSKRLRSVDLKQIGGRCMKVIRLLQLCCEKCNNESTHCAPLSELLNMSSNRFNAKMKS